jgi:hypothetical protein
MTPVKCPAPNFWACPDVEMQVEQILWRIIAARLDSVVKVS